VCDIVEIKALVRSRARSQPTRKPCNAWVPPGCWTTIRLSASSTPPNVSYLKRHV